MTTKFEDVKFQFKKDVLSFLDKHIEKYGRLEIRYQVMDGYARYVFEKDRLRIAGYAEFAGVSSESNEAMHYMKTGKFPEFGAEFFGDEILKNISFELICDIAKRIKD